MGKVERVFLVVLDSLGIGAMDDAADYGDEGSHTLRALSGVSGFATPNLRRLGLYNIEGVNAGEPYPSPEGAFARLAERSTGKDTTTGHWEMMGLVSERPFPTYPDGFPEEVLARFAAQTGRGVLCNKPYSGTQVILDYGEEHMRSGRWIVYTSADSVFQIAAHEGIIPLDELYRACRTARALLTGAHAVGRVIARPFAGAYPAFTRTVNRHDFSLPPAGPTLLDQMLSHGLDTIGIGKISDIFAGRGLSDSVSARGNDESVEQLHAVMARDFHGLCFVNLVDFDMLYGHRNDAPGYAAALMRFDEQLGAIERALRGSDVLLITADHGCDPSTPSTDHSREYVPLLAKGACIRPGTDLRTRAAFADVAATIAVLLDVPYTGAGTSMAEALL